MLELAGFKIRPIFAWYDLWIGCYYDQKGRKLYILPLPSVGIVIEFPVHITLMALVKGTPGETRMFNSIEDARLYVKTMVGDDPTIDNYRIISKDGNTRIIVTGCDVKELFQNVIFLRRKG